MIKPVIEHTIWIDTPRERVWRAITETTQIKQWWGAKGYAEISELSVGATIKFSIEDNPLFATIRNINPPHQFVYEWPPHPRYFSVPFVTRYILDEEDNGTRVTLSESGFEAWPDDEIRQVRFGRIDSGFRMLLENLKAYLDGRSLPHLF